MNDGLLYIYDGPPVVSGDPSCQKCGGTEFRWEGKCVKCVDKEIDRWNNLKNVLLSMTSRTELTEDYYTGDQRWGFNEALSRVESIMEKLEEK